MSGRNDVMILVFVGRAILFVNLYCMGAVGVIKVQA